MTDTTERHNEIALPVLLRAARNVYADAIRKALAENGFDDVPRNGIYAMGAIAKTGVPLSQIIRDLGVSKQAAGQLIDSLVLRGYLERTADDEDRRRLNITLTHRGRAVIAVSGPVVEGLEADLLNRVGAEHVAHTRATLGALITAYHQAA